MSQRQPPCTCDRIVAGDDPDSMHVTSGALRLVTERTEDSVRHAVLSCTACDRQLAYSRDDSFHQPEVRWRRISTRAG